MLPRQRAELAALVFAVGLLPGASPAAAQHRRRPQHRRRRPRRRILSGARPPGAFLGFVEASQRGNRAAAASTCSGPAEDAVSKEDAATSCASCSTTGSKAISIGSVATPPQSRDGLPAHRDRAGTAVLANGERVDIFLSRTEQASGPAVWLIASDTVADIPRMYQHAAAPARAAPPRFMTSASFGELRSGFRWRFSYSYPSCMRSRSCSWGRRRALPAPLQAEGLSVPLRRSRAGGRSRGRLHSCSPWACIGSSPAGRHPAPHRSTTRDGHRPAARRHRVVAVASGGSGGERMRDHLRPDHPRTAQSVYVLAAAC